MTFRIWERNKYSYLLHAGYATVRTFTFRSNACTNSWFRYIPHQFSVYHFSMLFKTSNPFIEHLIASIHNIFLPHHKYCKLASTSYNCRSLILISVAYVSNIISSKGTSSLMKNITAKNRRKVLICYQKPVYPLFCLLFTHDTYK